MSRDSSESEVWEFADADDARRYLGEVARLWGAWTVGLILLLSVRSVWLLLVAVVLVVAMIWLARPLQRRVDLIEGGDEVVGGRFEAAMGRGRRRDRALRELAYGEEAFKMALAQAGAKAQWLWARRAMVALTVVAFVLVIVETISRS